MPNIVKEKNEAFTLLYSTLLNSLLTSFLRLESMPLSEGGDRVVVPWYNRGGTWYNIVQM